MKDYDVMAEITIAKTVTIQAPDADTAQIMAKEALESLYNRLGRQYIDHGTDELIVDIGDATEVEE